MTRSTQGLLLAFVGAVMLRLSLGDAYLRYVTEWMKWPIAASGALLVLLAVGPLLGLGERRDDAEGAHADDDEHAGHDHGRHGVPLVTWLLVLPGLTAFMIAPPALGSYLAERRADESALAEQPAVVTPIAAGDDVPVDVAEFAWRAQDGDSLDGRTVALTGFVSHGAGDAWYVTRMSIGCCAADAMSHRVEVEDAERPPRDTWVTVTGEHVPGTGALDPDGASLASTAAISAASVTETTAPAQTYD